MTDTPAMIETQDRIKAIIASALYGAVGRENARHTAACIIDDLRESGFAIVPREPTEVMIDSALALDGETDDEREPPRLQYMAMVEVAGR